MMAEVEVVAWTTLIAATRTIFCDHHHRGTSDTKRRYHSISEHVQMWKTTIL